MKTVFHICLPWNLPGLITIGTLLLFMIQSTHANTFEDLQAKLPGKVGRWSAPTDDRVFDDKTIFSYIDGAAEVYRAYNFKRCLSRRYTTLNGPAIILDLFEMGSSEDAFGVFTHDLDGTKVAVGQDGRLRPGWLSFWRAHYFVSIYMEEETAAAEQAVMELGRLVADKITGNSTTPEILNMLPPVGLKSDTIRYLHHFIVLNYHYYLSDENILNISAETDAALAEYQIENQSARMLLVIYPTAEMAAKSWVAFLRHYLPDADKKGMGLLENNKWAAIDMNGKLLAIVLEADSRRLAEQLLGQMNIIRLRI
jgi:hypothetical protein